MRGRHGFFLLLPFGLNIKFDFISGSGLILEIFGAFYTQLGILNSALIA